MSSYLQEIEKYISSELLPHQLYRTLFGVGMCARTLEIDDIKCTQIGRDVEFVKDILSSNFRDVCIKKIIGFIK